MSYARFAEEGSDVYVFASTDAFKNTVLECCGCRISKDWTYYSTQTMVDHLEEHIKQGDTIPATLIPELWFDDKQNFPYSENDPE
jgi:hypothetical protein